MKGWANNTDVKVIVTQQLRLVKNLNELLIAITSLIKYWLFFRVMNSAVVNLLLCNILNKDNATL